MKQISQMIQMDHIPESFSAVLCFSVFSVPPFAFEVDLMMNVIRRDMFPPGKMATRCCVLPNPSLCLVPIMSQLHSARVIAKTVNRFLIRETK